MNRMDWLLHDELNRLSDRLGALARPDTAAGLRSRDPELAQQIDTASAELAELRLDLVERYERWADALDACEALWVRAEAGAAADRGALERRAA